MKRNTYREQQIANILQEVEAGVPVAELRRQLDFSQNVFYKRKAKCGGMEIPQLKRLKELEEENHKLNQMNTEINLEYKVLKDILKKSSQHG